MQRAQASSAILALNQKDGSSRQEIKKFLQLSPDKFLYLNKALAAGVRSRLFIQNKGKNSKYKVSSRQHS